jgi:hypothetical protein
MPCVGFEPTNPVFEQVKIFHESDSAATVNICNHIIINPAMYIYNI